MCKQSPQRKQEVRFAYAAAERFDEAIQAYLYDLATAGTEHAASRYEGARLDFERDGLAFFIGAGRVGCEARQARAKKAARRGA